MTYRLSIESNDVNRTWAYFLLGEYNDEKLARLDAVGLMAYLGDEVKTIGVKWFNGKEFELLDVYDGQEWFSEIEAHNKEEFERHGA
jgi:hypothetical protein